MKYSTKSTSSNKCLQLFFLTLCIVVYCTSAQQQQDHYTRNGGGVANSTNYNNGYVASLTDVWMCLLCCFVWVLWIVGSLFPWHIQEIYMTKGIVVKGDVVDAYVKEGNEDMELLENSMHHTVAISAASMSCGTSYSQDDGILHQHQINHNNSNLRMVESNDILDVSNHNNKNDRRQRHNNDTYNPSNDHQRIMTVRSADDGMVGSTSNTDVPFFDSGGDAGYYIPSYHAHVCYVVPPKPPAANTDNGIILDNDDHCRYDSPITDSVARKKSHNNHRKQNSNSTYNFKLSLPNQYMAAAAAATATSSMNSGQNESHSKLPQSATSYNNNELSSSPRRAATAQSKPSKDATANSLPLVRGKSKSSRSIKMNHTRSYSSTRKSEMPSLVDYIDLPDETQQQQQQQQTQQQQQQQSQSPSSLPLSMSIVDNYYNVTREQQKQQQQQQQQKATMSHCKNKSRSLFEWMDLFAHFWCGPMIPEPLEKQSNPIRVTKRFDTTHLLRKGIHNVDVVVIPGDPTSGILKATLEQEFMSSQSTTMTENNNHHRQQSTNVTQKQKSSSPSTNRRHNNDQKIRSNGGGGGGDDDDEEESQCPNKRVSYERQFSRTSLKAKRKSNEKSAALGAILSTISTVGAVNAIMELPYEKRCLGWIMLVTGLTIMWPVATYTYGIIHRCKQYMMQRIVSFEPCVSSKYSSKYNDGIETSGLFHNFDGFSHHHHNVLQMNRDNVCSGRSFGGRSFGGYGDGKSNYVITLDHRLQEVESGIQGSHIGLNGSTSSLELQSQNTNDSMVSSLSDGHDQQRY